MIDRLPDALWDITYTMHCVLYVRRAPSQRKWWCYTGKPSYDNQAKIYNTKQVMQIIIMKQTT